MLVVNARSKVVVINFGQMGPERNENAGQNYVFGKIHCTAAELHRKNWLCCFGLENKVQ